jgi:hypothetical protein
MSKGMQTDRARFPQNSKTQQSGAGQLSHARKAATKAINQTHEMTQALGSKREEIFPWPGSSSRDKLCI